MLPYLEKLLRHAGGREAVAISNTVAATVATADQAGGRLLELTGALTAARELVVPHVDGGQWTIWNHTTGGFNVTVRGPTGAGVSVAADAKVIVESNAVDFFLVGGGAGSGTTPTGPAGGSLSGTYPNPGIGSNAVTATQLAAGAVTTAKIADAQVTAAKLGGGSTGKILFHNGTAWAELAPGTNGHVLTLAAGVPAWAAPAVGAPGNAQFLVLATDGTLTAERAMVHTARFSVTDGGANGNYTIDLATGGITNAYIAAGAAIDGSKVVPAFGAQAVSTSGTCATGALTVTGAATVSGLGQCGTMVATSAPTKTFPLQGAVDGGTTTDATPTTLGTITIPDNDGGGIYVAVTATKSDGTVVMRRMLTVAFAKNSGALTLGTVVKEDATQMAAKSLGTVTGMDITAVASSNNIAIQGTGLAATFRWAFSYEFDDRVKAL